LEAGLAFLGLGGHLLLEAVVLSHLEGRREGGREGGREGERRGEYIEKVKIMIFYYSPPFLPSSLPPYLGLIQRDLLRPHFLQRFLPPSPPSLPTLASSSVTPFARNSSSASSRLACSSFSVASSLAMS